jgi:PAS domain S-box-containing protein
MPCPERELAAARTSGRARAMHVGSLRVRALQSISDASNKPAEHGDGHSVEPASAVDDEAEARPAYRAFVCSSGHLTWTWAADGSFLHGESWQAFTGQSTEMLRSGRWLEAIHPEDLARVERSCLPRATVKTPIEIEFRLRRYDGAFRSMLARLVPAYHSNEADAWLGFATDITSKTASLDDAKDTALLQDSLDNTSDDASTRSGQLEAIFEGMVDGVLVCDGDGKILHMNSAYRNMLGLRDSDRPLVSLPEGRGRLFAPRNRLGEFVAEHKRPVARILRGEVLNGSIDSDYIVRTADGREILLSVSGAPVYHASRRIVGAVAIFRDVTDRRAMERRTQDALNALLALAEALVRDGVQADETESAAGAGMAERLARLTLTVLGCQRVVLVAHDEHGMAPIGGASVDPSRRERPPSWDSEEISRFLNDSLGDEVVGRLASGEVIAVDLQTMQWRQSTNPLASRQVLLCPMRIDNSFVGVLIIGRGPDYHEFSADERMLAGAVASLIGLLVERSRLRRDQARSDARELALRETNRRMNEFLGIAGHELRTPLTSISAGIQLAERRLQHAATGMSVDDGALATQFTMASTILGKIFDQIRRLDRLIGDLLDVSRIEADHLQLRLAPCDLVSLALDVVNDQRQLEPKRVIRFEAGETRGAPVLADADRIAQVVTNFITNALKYSPFESAITVRAAALDSCARVSVSDHGQGLHAEEQQQIWQRFYRAPSVEVQVGSGVGLGLGLHISSTIIERHAGKIGVDSVRGEGSTFWFELPLVDSHPPTQT